MASQEQQCVPLRALSLVIQSLDIMVQPLPAGRLPSVAPIRCVARIRPLNQAKVFRREVEARSIRSRIVLLENPSDNGVVGMRLHTVRLDRCCCSENAGNQSCAPHIE